MCGIAGIIQNHTKDYTREHLQKMTDVLAHRGPDGEGHWNNTDETCLLGHRRLSIIDLSDAGNQPMHYLGRYVIVHNGEIYNYVELRKELEKRGYGFCSKTDTEVIAAAYDCWGEECLQQFDGMFAFSIWDEKEKTLFAARDRFGEKPFFYCYDDNRLLFASEMKALWTAGIAKSPNFKMLFNYITIGYTDNPERPEETFYENIYKLPAASFLKFSFIYFSYSIQKYWDIDLANQQKKITDKEATETFSNLFAASIKRRLRSDVAVGTSLSGGLDSSSVIAQLSTIHQSPADSNRVTAFTASFPGFEKDETAYAKQMVKQFSLEHFTTNVSGNELMDDWEKLCYHQEEPFGSASIYAQYKVFELAKQQNIKVLLDGQGADETLAGYHKYYKWYWQELFRKRKLYRSKELTDAKQLGVAEKFDYKNMIAAYFPVFASVVMERQYLLKAIKQEDLTKNFVRLQSREAYYTPPEYFDLNGLLYFNTCTHGLEELLRYADRNSMAHGREVRLPFLSHELVEFIFSLPSHFKIRTGWTKWLLRTTMEKSLPAEIVWRRDKVGFEPPQKNWMELAAVKDAVHEAKRKLINENILRPEVINKPVVSLAAHEADNFDWRYLSAAAILK
ncbi:MAG TPA: asparagine synthase (glutamine-hydrolyzing) [Chitinophagaceae bacterium]|jgi:asparagine synthase (glutamine-hydrolysing)|nr:asparagine synthase (glutamine-hydrolyzing) [Chitinophagaceae bacterium]HMU59281.1 asparagine synthase (glutamine-hydrolyzing) [Chitinophagaceae bacterium]